ncbi:MAG: FAD-binding oxidoreductase, partial [Dehalococcoidia bacterium]
RVRKNINFTLNMALLKYDFKALLDGLLPGKRGAVAPVGLEPRRELKNLCRKQANLARIVPQLKGARIQRHWAGYVDMTPDFLPVLGKVARPEGLYLATGFSGHGFTVGPIVGKLMAELIVDGKTSLPLHTFRASRFSEEKVSMPRRLM